MRFAVLSIAAVLALSPVSAAAQWVENGVQLTTTGVSDWAPKTVSDGAGGAIVAWYDDNYDILVQRIDPYGRALWTPGGVPVCTASNGRWEARIASDGAGGAIVAWQDNRNGDYDVYAQRVNANGVPQWTANGVPVCVAAWDQFEIQMLPRNAGGVFVTWSDMRGGYPDIYYNVLDAGGSTAFGPSANALATTASSEGYARMAPDGLGGAIVAWSDGSTGSENILAQRINGDGAMLWAMGGITVCADPGEQRGARIVSDGAYGAIISWTDSRRGYGAYDIYAQRVNSSGAPLWTTDGVAVVVRDSGIDISDVVSDGRGGAILAWYDERYGEADIFCQRIDSYGGTYWIWGGAPVCVMDNAQYASSLVGDGDAGAIVAWYDYRNGMYADIYAQRIERNGYWGYPSPTIADIRDVPGDQGGLVDIAWDASRLDDWYGQLIAFYTVWRAIDHETALALASGVPDGAAALAFAARGALFIDDPSKFDPASKAPVIRVERTGASTFYWKLVSTVYAYYLDAYSETVATLFDSTAVSDEHHYFQVIAHCTYQGQFWTSPPDSGCSVDNLAPVPPAGLAGAQEYSPAGLALAWSPNTEADLGGYAVYRGSSADFVPSEANRVASPPDTLWFDGDWRWDSGYYYKLAAVDIHGNESGFALLAPEAITDAETPRSPEAAYLRQNFPNPFNPTTRIAYGLASPSNVSLRIYDASGRLVRALVDEQRAAGNYSELWDGRDSRGAAVASGIYFYRLTAGSFTQTRKMALLR